MSSVRMQWECNLLFLPEREIQSIRVQALPFESQSDFVNW